MGMSHKRKKRAMKSLFKLTKRATLKALAGRNIYRITCCAMTMRQIDILSKRARSPEDISLSIITLECLECKKVIIVECTTLMQINRMEIIRHLGVENPYDSTEMSFEEKYQKYHR